MAKNEHPELSKVIGLTWDKVQPSSTDVCDFCLSPIYNDGHWFAVSRRVKYDAVFKACKKCALEAGLNW